MANERYKSLSDVRTSVRDNLDESSASFWSNAQLLRYINRSKDRVWNRVKALNADYFNISRTSLDGALTILGESYTCTSFQIVAGTTDYNLPPDFSEMKLVECITSGYEQIRFIYRDMNNPEFRSLRAIVDNVTPSDYFLFDIFQDSAIRIAPKTDTTLDLRLTYVQIIADLVADSDRLTMPWPLYLAVEAFATGMALRQDRSPDALNWMQEGDKVIAEMFGAHHRQIQDVETAAGYLE